MAFVKDTLKWSTPADKAAFYLYAGITEGDDDARDARLELWFTEATYKADTHMENPFVDDDDVDVDQFPGVRAGVYEFTIACDAFTNSGAGEGIKAKKTAQLAETYDTSGGSSGPATMAQLALRAAAGHWRDGVIDLLKASDI